MIDLQFYLPFQALQIFFVITEERDENDLVDIDQPPTMKQPLERKKNLVLCLGRRPSPLLEGKTSQVVLFHV